MKLDRPRPDSRRVPSFDYTTPTVYFVTIVTHGRRHVFGRIVNAAMKLSHGGRIVERELKALPSHRPKVELDEFVVMPDHVHALLWIIAETTPDPDAAAARNFGAMVPHSLSAIVRGFKSASTRAIRTEAHFGVTPLWQRNFYERVVRVERELAAVRKYIIENPARASRGEDEHADWTFGGSDD